MILAIIMTAIFVVDLFLINKHVKSLDLKDREIGFNLISYSVSGTCALIVILLLLLKGALE